MITTTVLTTITTIWKPGLLRSLCCSLAHSLRSFARSLSTPFASLRLLCRSLAHSLRSFARSLSGPFASLRSLCRSLHFVRSLVRLALPSLPSLHCGRFAAHLLTHSVRSLNRFSAPPVALGAHFVRAIVLP